MRSEYMASRLDEGDLMEDPFAMLRHWLDLAVQANVMEPTAMCVATVGAGGRPSSRMVLLRGLGEGRLVFYSNRASRKGRELEANPWLSATLWWGVLERQVRIEGKVTQTSDEEADEYFASRPRLSQLAAHASPQSESVPSRKYLEGRLEEFRARFPSTVPRPENWGGYVIEPDRFEFWQGRKGRLHDRFVYLLESGAWRIVRLAP